MHRNRRAGLAFVVAAVVAGSLGSAGPALAQTQPPSSAGEQWPQSPARAADPPLLPAPTPGAPLSTSGTDVAPPPNQGPPAPILVNDADASRIGEDARAKIRQLENRVALDEVRLKALEDDLGPLRHLKFEGYVQLQYRYQSFNAAASPNLVNGSLPAGISSNDVIAKPDGTTTNSNLFRLRRTRLRATYQTDIIRVFLQLDLLPAGGPTATQGTIARNAEAAGTAHWTPDVETRFIGGLFEVPFRNELLESSMVRPYVERTWAMQNMFPTERDLGIHAKTFVKKDRAVFDVGILNGQRLGEKQFVSLPDLNAAKDFFAMAQGKLGPLTASLYGYAGRGEIVDPVLLRVKNYSRLGANLGLTFAHTFLPKLGETKAMGELLFGSNMDTGVIYAFAKPAVPAVFTDGVRDLNQRALYLRADQEITKWALAGFRFDTYTTDSSVKNNARDTYTFMAGLRFSKHLRLINELSYAIDNIHPVGAPAPSRDIYAYTGWMQGSFF